MDLKNVSTEELMNELLERKDNQVIKAVQEINENIKLINGFGIKIEHETESIKLLPNFSVKKDNEGKVVNVFYRDVEY